MSGIRGADEKRDDEEHRDKEWKRVAHLISSLPIKSAATLRRCQSPWRLGRERAKRKRERAVKDENMASLSEAPKKREKKTARRFTATLTSHVGGFSASAESQSPVANP